MSDYTGRSMLITSAVARIERGPRQKFHLGNLDARRDWRYGTVRAPRNRRHGYMMRRETRSQATVYLNNSLKVGVARA